MSYYIGIDIGGTKIAGALFDGDGISVLEKKLSTPVDYQGFLNSCSELVKEFDEKAATKCPIGIGVAGVVDQRTGYVSFPANLQFLKSIPLRNELSNVFSREIKLANDASCAALAEAIDGAGAGYNSVLGYIIGTGAGSSLVYNKKLMEGPNGMTGELGHLPLPFREDEDGPLCKCGCGQTGCIEQSISGPALARLYNVMTNKIADAEQIAVLAKQGDGEALRVLDRYYEVVAKAMVAAMHSFDPDVIVISGGVSNLDGIYKEVPKRWGKYTCISSPVTKIVPAMHGPMAGVRGAALLWKNVS